MQHRSWNIVQVMFFLGVLGEKKRVFDCFFRFCWFEFWNNCLLTSILFFFCFFGMYLLLSNFMFYFRILLYFATLFLNTLDVLCCNCWLFFFCLFFNPVFYCFCFALLFFIGGLSVSCESKEVNYIWCNKHENRQLCVREIQ